MIDDYHVPEVSFNDNQDDGTSILKPGVTLKSEYDDFQTIDWQRDIARDRIHRRSVKVTKKQSFLGFLWAVNDSWSGWVCTFLVGVFAGSVAGIVDIGATWLADIKLGICASAPHLNREQCCWSSNETVIDIEGNCTEWKTWKELSGLQSSPIPGYIISYFIYVIWAVIFASLAASLVRIFAPYACGSGIPEIKTILSGFVIKGYLGKSTLIVKSMSVMLAVAAGLSLGKEGPMVHMACCTGNILAHLFPKYGENEAKKREILSAASAAGVSVAFGSPIGGVLFSLEEVSYYFPLKTLWRSFFCALVAAFVLRAINPFGNDHSVLFYVDYNTPWNFVELLPFLLIGILGGLMGSLFIKANIAWCRFRKESKLGLYPIREVIIVAIVTAVLSYPNSYTRMATPDLIYLLFSECGTMNRDGICNYGIDHASAHPTNITTTNSIQIQDNNQSGTVEVAILKLIFAFILKMILTVITFGMRIPAGLFVPSLAMGAIMGRIVGIAMQFFVDSVPSDSFFILLPHCADLSATTSSSSSCITPGLYGMVGAAAMLGGVTRMTVSLVVIMFELTGGVRYIVPLMVASMASKWVGDGISRRGVYDAHIELNEYPFLDSKNSESFSDELAHSTAYDIVKSRASIVGSDREDDDDNSRLDIGNEEVGRASCSQDPSRVSPRTIVHYITQDSMYSDEVERLICDHPHQGYPIVLSHEIPRLVGYILRSDLMRILPQTCPRRCLFVGRKRYESQNENESDVSIDENGVVRLDHLVDLAPTTINRNTTIDSLVALYGKLGLRHSFVTSQDNKLLAIITKKDVLNYIRNFDFSRSTHTAQQNSGGGSSCFNIFNVFSDIMDCCKL